MPHHTNSNGVDTPAFQRAIAEAAALAAASGSDVIFLCPTFANVDSDAVVETLGEKGAAAFRKNREITINGVRFHLETAQKKRTINPSAVLALYVPLPLLEKAIADYRTKDWVYVPWSAPELAEYVAAHPASKPV